MVPHLSHTHFQIPSISLFTNQSTIWRYNLRYWCQNKMQKRSVKQVIVLLLDRNFKCYMFISNKKFWEEIIAYFTLVQHGLQQKTKKLRYADRQQGDLISLLLFFQNKENSHKNRVYLICQLTHFKMVLVVFWVRWKSTVSVGWKLLMFQGLSLSSSSRSDETLMTLTLLIARQDFINFISPESFRSCIVMCCWL
jgi:hypothetical protein